MKKPINPDKNCLWKALRKAEQKARNRATGATGVHYMSSCDEGREALSLLNQILKKPKNTRLKKYSPDEISRGLEIVNSDGFVSQLVDNYRQEISSPDSQMSLLRAQSLAMGTPVQYPAELIERAKKNKEQRIRDLWEKLEKMGIEVHELVDEGRGIIGFKISTPITTYLDFGTSKEILELARMDIELAKQARCYFCHNPINYHTRDFFGNLSCPACGAFCSFIPENIGKKVMPAIYDHFGYEGLRMVLQNWDGWYSFDDEAGCSWLNLSQVEDTINSTKPLSILGPETDNLHSKLEVPFFSWWEEEDDDDDDEVKFSTCFLCCYRGTIMDERGVILGVENGSGNVWESHVCLYPHRAEEVFPEKFLRFQPERLRGYQEIDDAIVWNVFMGKFIEQFSDVSNQSRDLEAFYPEMDEKFHGPICPRFKLDTEHWDLEEQGGSYRVKGNTVAEFGRVNFDALEKERLMIEREKREVNLQEKFRLLKDRPDLKQIFTERVEMGLEFKERLANVVTFLAEHFAREELELLKQDLSHLRTMNMSKKAQIKVVELVLARKE